MTHLSLQTELRRWEKVFRRPVPFTSPAEALVAALYRLNLQFERARNKFCKRVGLSDLAYHIGLALHLQSEVDDAHPLCVRDLHEVIGTGKQDSVSAVLARMAEDHLVETTENPDDRRERFVKLTVKGQATIERARSELRKDASQWFADAGLGNTSDEEAARILSTI